MLLSEEKFESTINAMISAGLVTRAEELREHERTWRERDAESQVIIEDLREELQDLERELGW